MGTKRPAEWLRNEHHLGYETTNLCWVRKYLCTEQPGSLIHTHLLYYGWGLQQWKHPKL